MDQITNSIVEGLRSAFGNNPWVIVFIISMLPMVEVRGAIPIGVSLGMNLGVAAIFSAVSALIICPILLFFLKPILDYLKKTKVFQKLAQKVEEMFLSKAKNIEKDAETDNKKTQKSDFYKALGLYIFVALPLPGTGVWTGSAIAAFMNLKYKYSLPALILGNFTAAGIITFLTYLLGDKSYIILIILFVFMIITIIGLLMTLFFKNKKNAADSSGAQAEMSQDTENERKD